MSDIYYPRLLRRVQAMIIDEVIMTIIFVTLIGLISYLEIDSGYINSAILLVPLFFYDPLFVTILGGTIGHHMLGLRVRREKEDIKLNIVQSSLRFIIKSVLGIISVIMILMTKKHQAIHDKFTQSIVILSSTKNLPAREIQAERG
jgi:uncharacterized RDD family membrane protein YckC